MKKTKCWMLCRADFFYYNMQYGTWIRGNQGATQFHSKQTAENIRDVLIKHIGIHFPIQIIETETTIQEKEEIRFEL